MIKFNFSLPLFFCLTGCALQRTNAGKQTGKSSETYIRLKRSSGGQHPGSCLWHWCVSLGYLDGYALHVYCNLNFEVAWTCIFAFSFSVICSRGQIAVKIRDFGKPAGNFNKGKVWSTMCSQQTFDVWTLLVKVRIFQVSLLSMWTQEN